jgi:hypothetical protein
MSGILWILMLVVFLFGGTLGLLAMVVIGIRSSEHRSNLYGPPCSRAEFASRRLLGGGCANPAPDRDDIEE